MKAINLKLHNRDIGKLSIPMHPSFAYLIKLSLNTRMLELHLIFVGSIFQNLKSEIRSVPEFPSIKTEISLKCH